ncbi:MBL fold metallo-hydrolase [Clostridium sp. D2Q-11]|uniref:MBL fold metallo-hydrolase n=1 Tax=Anaeromonas frigoriresistens TaxID=2683708 RepID=A0A942UW54_9FIRM|nr:MBL fold metallo-hydrolase [Anaeromonas frigoriresistens]MBS4538630.1 MBL fold metallo-hydrolase [Anaeromonas frigoriresistens]
MLREVYKNIYQKEIPLPNNPLKILHSYIIVSDKRNLIIDTGFNREECRQALMSALDELNIDLNKTDLFITHLHSDHSGLAAELNREGIKVYTGEIDGKIINNMTDENYWEKFNEYNKLFDLEKYDMSYKTHPGYRYAPKHPVKYEPLKEGDRLTVGEYSFEIIDIPGHTPGHIGLYDKDHKIFFGGDHVLNRITPNISFWGFEYNILDTYLKSLKKVKEMDIDYIFSSHRRIVEAHRERINELYNHHEDRLREVTDIINKDEKTVSEVASEMHWDFKADTWDDFPNPQKWFATAEAMSHLEHLVFINKAKKREEKGKLYYIAI